MTLSMLKQHQSCVFFLLTLCAGVVLLLPTIDVQPFLSQGDHGRDLYAFEQTLNGKGVYRDFWWVYGPLMPVYYAFFDQWLGTNIQSILFAEMLLTLASGLLIYATLATLFNPGISLIGGLWMWVFGAEFFFTYNHTGGILCLVAVVFFLFLYLKNPRIRYLLGGLGGIFLLSLIKINFGFSALGAFLVSIVLADWLLKNPFSPQKKYVYLVALGMPIVILMIYAFLSRGLTVYEIRQCFPYIKGDQPFESPIWESVKFFGQFTLNNMRASWGNLIFASIVLFSLAQSLYLVIGKKLESRLSRHLSAAMAIVLIFLVLNAHEFLLSGVFYRFFWARPFQILAIFMVIATASYRFPRILKGLVYLTLLVVVTKEASAQLRFVEQWKTPAHYLSHPRAKIFVGNSPQWIDTVNKTTDYLSAHLKPKEPFFALPYECLYYYLTGRESPTRQLIFFEHIKIPAEQERKVIEDLEGRKIDFVLLSNRLASPEQGLGVLGRDYCPLLAKYLEDHFRVVAIFGDWKNPPGWAWNHGTMILKRNPL